MAIEAIFRGFGFSFYLLFGSMYVLALIGPQKNEHVSKGCSGQPKFKVQGVGGAPAHNSDYKG